MAIFVTFVDKLGYTLSAVYALRGKDGVLPCKIKRLEGCLQGNYWHPKCNLFNE
jgi:hypothetical protein